VKTISTKVEPAKYAERVAEMGQAIARESDLADTLANALRWYIADDSVGHRNACLEALATWRAVRDV
jgi:hypothetical protein